MQSIEKRAIESIFAGGILFLVTFLQSIALVPFFLKNWGSEKYGVWLTMQAFVLVMRSLDAGHQTFVGNEFNKLFHLDKQKAKQVLASSIKIAFLLGGFELFIYLMILLSGNHSKFVGFDLQTSPVSLGIISLMLMWMLVGSVGGILVRVILPLGAYAKSVYFNIGIKIAETICIVACVSLGGSLNLLSIVIALIWFFYTLYLFAFIRKLMPEFYPWWHGGNWSLGVRNLIKSMAFTFNNVVEQFNTNGVLIAISNLTTVSKVPIFTTIRTVSNVFTQATLIVLNPLVPDLIRFHVTSDRSKLIDLIKANWFVGTLIINVPFVFIIPIVKPLFSWWTNNSIPFNAPLFYTLAYSVVILNHGRIFVLFFTCINELRVVTIITLARFFVVAGMGSVMLIQYGISGVGWAFLVSELIASLIIPFFYFFYKSKYADFHPGDVFKASLPTVALGIFFLLAFFLTSYVWQLFVTFLFVIVWLLIVQWLAMPSSLKDRFLSNMFKFKI